MFLNLSFYFENLTGDFSPAMLFSSLVWRQNWDIKLDKCVVWRYLTCQGLGMGSALYLYFIICFYNYSNIIHYKNKSFRIIRLLFVHIHPSLYPYYKYLNFSLFLIFEYIWVFLMYWLMISWVIHCYSRYSWVTMMQAWCNKFL